MTNRVDRAFLRRCDLFESQPEEILDAIGAQGRVVSFGAGATIFRRGERGDSLCIVKEGVLEVLSAGPDGADGAPVAYLGPGEFLGELALLTGSPRTATVRSPQGAELLILERPVFRDLMTSFPDFVRNLCVVLARRLEGLLLRASKISSKELQGDLRFFDLGTVIQTLIGAQQTGALTVTSGDAGQRLAEIVFSRGDIWRARCRALSGDEAVYQLFLRPPEGEFAFTSRPVRDEERSPDVTMPSMTLLLESARLQDELAEIRKTLPPSNARLRARADHLSWSDEGSLELALAIFTRLKRGTTIEEIERDIPRGSYAICQALKEMKDARIFEAS